MTAQAEIHAQLSDIADIAEITELSIEQITQWRKQLKKS